VSNLNLFMRLNWDGSRAAAGLSQSSAQLKKFTDGAARQFTGLRKQAHELSSAMGGFSSITRLAGAYVGLQTAREAMGKNMDFERTMLEAKQLADMTDEQAARLRKAVIETSKFSLAGPMELALGEQQMANAGVKFDDLIGSMKEGARAAAVFRSEFQDTMNMDTDLMQKAGIAAKDLAAVHNLLYVHSKAGRFEAKSLSRFAPVYLSELKQWGISGVRGVNFGGALLQSLQKIVPATEPGEVVTLLKQGLSHLAQQHTLKNLQKYYGIDPRKYAPGGKFRNVEDVLALASAMKAKGMMDPFKMGKVFREEYARKFWIQIMQDTEEIRKAMREGEQAMSEDTVGKDFEEMMRGNFAKAARTKNAAERAALSKPATAGTALAARVMEYASENPLQAGLGALGLFMGGRLLWNRMRNGKAGGGAGGLAEAAAGMAGVQRVFVVNMPGAAGMGGGQLALPPGEGWSPAAAAKTARLSRAAAAAKGALKLGAPLALGIGAFEAWGVHKNDQLDAEAKKLEYGRIGGGVAGGLGGAAAGAAIGAWFGGVGAIPGALIGGWLGNMAGEKAGRAAAEKIVLQNTIQMDGRVVAQQVQEYLRDAALRD